MPNSHVKAARNIAYAHTHTTLTRTDKDTHMHTHPHTHTHTQTHVWAAGHAHTLAHSKRNLKRDKEDKKQQGTDFAA
jgi:hypothetical protein